MASLSADLKLVLLALGEEGYGSETNYGDVQNDNWEIVEDALRGQSSVTVDASDVTLTDAQQQTLHLNLSGTLTGNRSIILKASQKGLFIVSNGTSGSYTVTVKPSAGTGVVVEQGKRAWIYSDGSTASFITKLSDLLSQETVSSDADFTLTWGSNSETIRHTGTLTADRAVTLSTTGAIKGARWRVTRTGSGAFNLNIGTGPLKELRQNMWAEFVYDGSAWYLAEHGVTTTSAFAQTLLDDEDDDAMRATLGISDGVVNQIEKQTVSSPVASVVFDDIASSGYSSYLLVFYNVATARVNQNDTIQVQVSTDNGSTFKTTLGDYYTSSGQTNDIARAVVAASTATLKLGSGIFEIHGLGIAARPTVGYVRMYGALLSTTGVETGDDSSATDTKVRVAAEADNAIRVVSINGDDISQGTFILYGVTET